MLFWGNLGGTGEPGACANVVKDLVRGAWTVGRNVRVGTWGRGLRDPARAAPIDLKE